MEKYISGKQEDLSKLVLKHIIAQAKYSKTEKCSASQHAFENESKMFVTNRCF